MIRCSVKKLKMSLQWNNCVTYCSTKCTYRDWSKGLPRTVAKMARQIQTSDTKTVNDKFVLHYINS